MSTDLTLAKVLVRMYTRCSLVSILIGPSQLCVL